MCLATLPARSSPQRLPNCKKKKLLVLASAFSARQSPVKRRGPSSLNNTSRRLDPAWLRCQRSDAVFGGEIGLSCVLVFVHVCDREKEGFAVGWFGFCGLWGGFSCAELITPGPRYPRLYSYKHTHLHISAWKYPGLCEKHSFIIEG